MTSTKVLARTAGLLYLIVAVAGGFSEYVRTSVTVSGDAASTAANVVQHAVLFRTAFMVDFVDQIAFFGVGLLLYVILRSVHPDIALAMLLLNVLGVALQTLNMLNHLGALLVATDPHYTAGLGAAARQSLVLFFLEMHRQGYLIAQIFFGSYLLPLGHLVYRSRMFPRTLGVILAIGGVGYLAGIVSTYASPGFQSNLATPCGLVGGIAELAFLVWLLGMGTGDAVIEHAPIRAASPATS
jgi:hypothetical protein